LLGERRFLVFAQKYWKLHGKLCTLSLNKVLAEMRKDWFAQFFTAKTFEPKRYFVHQIQ